ncbi:helix-turn-helix transcriptional regulator [Cellulomonas humilata]|uniref:Helix-turn-helix transcriptional regulator n=1 Tax=Cellulomonas humilata TaxID=144055 RepID=A0A7Y6DWX9_9CELL|nr:helix-turn-helix transcriptional regulator [Cellulomonas humilata]NUU17108.1 helix-turn-helix transcriptional regulator [Cellulomonas humilata]
MTPRTERYRVAPWTGAVAAQLRAERAAAGLTQEGLAARAGVPRTTYKRMEAGERAISFAQVALVLAALPALEMSEFVLRAERRLATPDAE